MEDDTKGKVVAGLKARKSNLGPVDVEGLSTQEDC
jgi:hypothetical protein